MLLANRHTACDVQPIRWLAVQAILRPVSILTKSPYGAGVQPIRVPYSLGTPIQSHEQPPCHAIFVAYTGSVQAKND
jgi:hypothetical protein